MNLFCFELLKIIKNKRNIFIVISCILFVFIFFGYSINRHQDYIDNMVLSLQSDNKYAISMLNSFENIENSEELYVNEIDFWSKEAITTSYLKNYYNTSTNFSWKDVLITKNERFSNLINGYNNALISISNQTVESKIIELKNEIYTNNYLLENSIEPLLSPFYPSAFNLVYMFNTKEVMLILSILFVLYIVEIFSGEIESGAYKITYTAPYSRFKILNVKILVSCLSLSILFICIFILLFILSSIVYGAGNITYPIVIKTMDSFSITSIFSVNILGFLYYWIISIFVIHIVSYIFLMFKDTSSIISVMSCLFLIVYIFTFSISTNSMSIYMPLGAFDYLSVIKIIGSEQYMFFIILYIIYMIIIHFMNSFIIRKIDFNGGL